MPKRSAIREHIAATVPTLTANACHTAWQWSVRGRQHRPWVRYAPGRSVEAVWYAFVVLHGREPISQLNHTCHVAACWNPHHVYEGTQLQNVHDMMAAGRLIPPPLPFAHKHSTGELNPKAKLTADDVRAIRLSLDSAQLSGRRYGVDPNTIRAIRKRITWKHVH